MSDYVELPIYDDELLAALGTDQNAVAINRAGRLAESQRVQLLRSLFRAGLIGVASLIGAAGCLMVAFVLGMTTGLGISLALLSGCFAAFIALAARYNLPLLRDIRGGVVSSIEGFVSSGERETRVRSGYGPGVPIKGYYWEVDSRERFWVSAEAFLALRPAEHRIYFLPKTRRVLAAEHVARSTGT